MAFFKWNNCFRYTDRYKLTEVILELLDFERWRLDNQEDNYLICWHKSSQSPRGKSARPLRQGPILVCLVCCAWLASAAEASTVHPELVEADVTDLDLIFEISRFRSGAGHDFSYFREVFSPEAMDVINDIDKFFATDTSEPESSMKHYYVPYLGFKGGQATVPV